MESKNQLFEARRAFGRMLGDALKTRGMKQEDLARSLGTTQSSVSGWINGKYEPAAGTVFTIERALDLDPGTLSRPLGYLPVEPAAQPVSIEAAIAQSSTLDDEDKAALASVYRALANHRKAPAPAIVPARPRPAPRPSRDRLATTTGSADRPRSVATRS